MNWNICRLCCSSEANINIFQWNDGQLCNKIRQCCVSVKIQEDDGFPQSICGGCERELDACYQFVLQCEEADRKIRSLINSGDSIHCTLQNSPFGIKSENNDDDCRYDLPYNVIEQSEQLFKSETVHQNNEPVTNVETKNKRQAKGKWLICSVCGRKCINSSALTIHMRTHTDERPHQCSSCDKTYKDRGTLKRHIERNHLQQRERKFMCENCGKGFYSKSDIQIHMRVHTRETPYTCPVCGARFTQLSAMLRHKRRHTDAKTHVCSTCTKPFWTKEELKKHLSVHIDVRNFSCPICSVLFKHKGSFQKHMKIHSEPNRFICNHCGKTCNNKGNLKSHMERKHSAKSGYCNVCLKNVSNIEVHMWRHTGHRPLKCDLCPSGFYEAKALAYHIKFKHKEANHIKCSVEGCTKSFPSKPMLSFHIAKFHEQKAPYPCGRCSRGFYRKNDLARHMLGTHKEKLQS